MRMLQFAPAYRARSWTWPSDEETEASGSRDRSYAAAAAAGVAVAATATAAVLTSPRTGAPDPMTGVQIIRRNEMSRSMFFVGLIGRLALSYSHMNIVFILRAYSIRLCLRSMLRYRCVLLVLRTSSLGKR